jgi:phage/plasmid-associated DNA primase
MPISRADRSVGRALNTLRSERLPQAELYEAYVAWCRERGIKPVGREEFYSIVASKFYKRREEGRVWFRGLMINPARAREQQSTLEGL